MSWLYLPPTTLRRKHTHACTAFPSAPEQAESTSASPSHVPPLGDASITCQAVDIALFVTSSGKHMLRPPSWRGWKTRPWIAHLSGTTLPPSMAACGVERWILSLVDIRASHSRSRASARGSTIPAIYGRTSRASSESANPNGCFWKTSPIISTSAIARSEKSWKSWALGLRKDCLRRQKSARRTSDSGCLFWPTPNVSGGGNPPQLLIRKGNHFVRPSGKKAHLGLDQVAKMWSHHPRWSHHSQWPTPAARDAKGANSREHVEVNGTGRRHMDQLANFAVHSLPAQQITRDGSDTSEKRRTLNPRFVEALMGWPAGWTSFAFAATEWSHWLQHMRFEFCRLGSLPMNDGQGVIL